MEILIAERLKGLLHDFDLKQSQLAKILNINKKSISSWLLEKSVPDINYLWLLADYFDVDIDYLVGRETY